MGNCKCKIDEECICCNCKHFVKEVEYCKERLEPTFCDQWCCPCFESIENA
ncbi:MAG: hypothetical protein ACOYJ1_01745 [Peptococcales bacterium]